MIKQAWGKFSVQEPALAPYRTAVQEIIKKFQNFSIKHTSGGSNRYADILATLGSQIRFIGGSVDVSIVKKDEYVLESMDEEEESKDWRSPIKKSFAAD